MMSPSPTRRRHGQAPRRPIHPSHSGPRRRYRMGASGIDSGPRVGALPRARSRIRARGLPTRRNPSGPTPSPPRPSSGSGLLAGVPSPARSRPCPNCSGLGPTARFPSGLDCCTDADAPCARALLLPARDRATATADPIALLEPAVDRARCSAPYGKRSPYPASSRSAIRCSRSPIARLPSVPFCSAVRISLSASDRIPTAAASSAPSSSR